MPHREQLCVPDILVLADMQAKYAAMLLQPRPLRESAMEAALRGVDGLVISR
ncbi:MAG: hypothetical protein KDI09_21855 [Halioglobus sp.]|nr:hypothetical protein [Halioglobus sp.]